MLESLTLPVLMALSWVPMQTAQAPADAPQKAVKSVQPVETVTCPITGAQIPSCCCPLNK